MNSESSPPALTILVHGLWQSGLELFVMKIGVMFGNPETTTGGNALKFCADAADVHAAFPSGLRQIFEGSGRLRLGLL